MCIVILQRFRFKGYSLLLPNYLIEREAKEIIPIRVEQDRTESNLFRLRKDTLPKGKPFAKVSPLGYIEALDASKQEGSPIR